MEKESVESFFEQLLKKAGKRKEIVNQKEGIIKYFARVTGESEYDIRIMLLKLEDMSLIKKCFSSNRTGHGGQIISKIKIIKTEFPFKPSRIFLKNTENHGKNLAAVLVDYDNVCGVMIKHGFQISFAKLRDFCRGFGRIIFPDIFLSRNTFLSQTADKKVEIIDSLWQLGFEVIVCPKQLKDKDAVDIKMKARMRKYAEHSSVGKIIIVSEDADLLYDPEINEFVRDLGKEIVRVMPSKYRAELEGIDDCSYISENLNIKVFTKIIEQTFQKKILSLEDKKRAEFIKDAIYAVNETINGKKFAFMTMLNAVWAVLYKKWHKNFCIQDLKAALNALVTFNILSPAIGNMELKNGNKEFTYYKLNNKIADEIFA